MMIRVLRRWWQSQTFSELQTAYNESVTQLTQLNRKLQECRTALAESDEKENQPLKTLYEQIENDINRKQQTLTTISDLIQDYTQKSRELVGVIQAQIQITELATEKSKLEQEIEEIKKSTGITEETSSDQQSANSTSEEKETPASLKQLQQKKTRLKEDLEGIKSKIENSVSQINLQTIQQAFDKSEQIKQLQQLQQDLPETLKSISEKLGSSKSSSVERPAKAKKAKKHKKSKRRAPRIAAIVSFPEEDEAQQTEEKQVPSPHQEKPTSKHLQEIPVTTVPESSNSNVNNLQKSIAAELQTHINTLVESSDTAVGQTTVMDCKTQLENLTDSVDQLVQLRQEKLRTLIELINEKLATSTHVQSFTRQIQQDILKPTTEEIQKRIDALREALNKTPSPTLAELASQATDQIDWCHAVESALTNLIEMFVNPLPIYSKYDNLSLKDLITLPKSNDQEQDSKETPIQTASDLAAIPLADIEQPSDRIRKHVTNLSEDPKQIPLAAESTLLENLNSSESATKEGMLLAVSSNYTRYLQLLTNAVLTIFISDHQPNSAGNTELSYRLERLKIYENLTAELEKEEKRRSEKKQQSESKRTDLSEEDQESDSDIVEQRKAPMETKKQPTSTTVVHSTTVEAKLDEQPEAPKQPSIVPTVKVSEPQEIPAIKTSIAHSTETTEVKVRESQVGESQEASRKTGKTQSKLESQNAKDILSVLLNKTLASDTLRTFFESKKYPQINSECDEIMSSLLPEELKKIRDAFINETVFEPQQYDLGNTQTLIALQTAITLLAMKQDDHSCDSVQKKLETQQAEVNRLAKGIASIETKAREHHPDKQAKGIHEIGKLHAASSDQLQDKVNDTVPNLDPDSQTEVSSQIRELVIQTVKHDLAIQTLTLFGQVAKERQSKILLNVLYFITDLLRSISSFFKSFTNGEHSSLFKRSEVYETIAKETNDLVNPSEAIQTSPAA